MFRDDWSGQVDASGFRPLSREPFFNENGEPKLDSVDGKCFRPLSWGLFFNDYTEDEFINWCNGVFVPFLGDFFSIKSMISNKER